MKSYAYILEYNNGVREIIPIDNDEQMDKYAWERLFHKIPQEQLEVLVCLYLGMTPLEIVAALDFANIGRFYNVSAGLRETYREQKAVFLA